MYLILLKITWTPLPHFITQHVPSITQSYPNLISRVVQAHTQKQASNWCVLTHPIRVLVSATLLVFGAQRWRERPRLLYARIKGHRGYKNFIFFLVFLGYWAVRSIHRNCDMWLWSVLLCTYVNCMKPCCVLVFALLHSYFWAPDAYIYGCADVLVLWFIFIL